MFKYVTGNLLESDADCLVNTVNCEGYMGKGIAYQFKLAFPQNNEDYIKACKNRALRIGKVHYYFENGKIIINFPTKDKWRAKSKIEYIEDGLYDLCRLIPSLSIKSIAIPPLGSGNGGLIWNQVKPIIETKLYDISNQIDVIIYEPSKNYVTRPTIEPPISVSALVLMQIKFNLKKFDKLRLQKTAYLTNIFANQEYFKFKRHKFGPYDNAIEIISKNIKEYQTFHNASSTEEAYGIAYNRLVSNNTINKLETLSPYIVRATTYVNSIENNSELECLSTILFLLQESRDLNQEQIISKFKDWSEDKATRFSEKDIGSGIAKLSETGLIQKTIMGYRISDF